MTTSIALVRSADGASADDDLPDACPEIAGQSALLRTVLREIDTVAVTNATVLVCGETGTGKELVARAIHVRGARASGPFVRLNCAAIAPSLLESELFGHERGAFTGALARRIGRFELAHDGTLFLDEIGEMAMELQPKLLRVLQEREFERVGSGHTLATSARVVAATNRDLEAMVADRAFREDLFYRLNVFPICLPPLRERREDIPLLAESFVRRFARALNKNVTSISPRTMSALQQHDWPGNVRELQNVLERAVILATGPVLEVSHRVDHRRASARPVGDALKEIERAHIVTVLRKTNGVVGGPNGAATRLGMNRSTLNFRMKKLGIVRSK
jgi:formate hydrogenlyase transcriptional activator